jgi:hypothetical protein
VTHPHAREAHPPGGIGFWIGMFAGASIVAFGVRGLLTHLRPTRIVNLSVFFGASGVFHDAIWAPLLVAGGMATRRLPLRMRRPIRVCLVLSLALVAFVVPELAGPSTRVRNPTVLPLDYRRNLAATLVVIWCCGAVVVARTYWRKRRNGVSP